MTIDLADPDKKSKSLSYVCDKILRWSLSKDLYVPISGDCIEGFETRQVRNRVAAKLWLYKQVLLILWHHLPTTQKGSLMFIISSLIVTVIIIMTFWLGGEFSIYINLPSLLIVAVPAILAPFIIAGKASVGNAFKMLVDSTLLNDCDTPSRYVEVFDVISKTAMLMGWFGIVSGAIAIASNVEAGSFTTVIGPAFAVLCITLLYALIIKMFCYLAKLRILSSSKAIHKVTN